MKNLKSKISMLLSLSLIGAMLTVPCAQAQAETTQWKTLYEQDFRNPNMTVEDVLNAGWKTNNKQEISMNQLNGSGGDAAYGFQMNPTAVVKNIYATYETKLGTKYKITTVVQFTGNNMAIGLGNKEGNWVPGFAFSITDDSYAIKLESGEQKAVVAPIKGSDNKATNIRSYEDYTVEIERDGTVLTANVKKGNDSVCDTLSVNDETFTAADGKLTLFGSASYGATRVKSVKIEIPQDYVANYETVYTNTAKTVEEYENQGWIHGYRGDTKPERKTEISGTNLILRSTGGYIYYNKDLGEGYEVETNFGKYYNSVSYNFNAVIDNIGNMISGFYLDLPNDYETGTVTLGYRKNNANTTLTTGTVGAGGNGYTLNIKYNNGLIKITDTTRKIDLTYDATDLVAQNPELAHGIMGQCYSTAQEAIWQGSFTFKQPAKNNINTLIPVVSGENVNYSVKVDNNGRAALNGAKVIVAAYDNANNLIGIDTDAAYSGALGQQTVSGSFAIGEQAPASYKAFLFDGLDTIKPLANSITKSVSAE